mgnify:CR=1 FL=1
MTTEMDGTGRELVLLAGEIATKQGAAGASDTAWVRRYPGLGSTKTYKLIQRGEIGGLDPDRWLLDYRAVAELLDSVGPEAEEPLYADLSPVQRLATALAEAMRESSNRRLVLVTGEPGMGKTTAARLVAGRWGQRVVLAEAEETWRDSISAMLGGLLRALGVRQLPMSAADRLEAVRARLCSSRTALIIDEAHHLGPRALNLVKTLINQTPGEFVFLCLPTLWRRLETQAYEEARQLTTNRMIERIALEGIGQGDAARFLERRVPGLNGHAGAAAELARAEAGKRGGFAWMAAVAREASRLEVEDVEGFSRALARAAQLRGVGR